MTEAEWMKCSDPEAMLEFLRGKISDRKLRLFGVACCHHIWHLLPDERCRRAVVIAELFADGQMAEAEAEAAGNAAAEVMGDAVQGIPPEVGWRAAEAVVHLLPPPDRAYQLNAVWEVVAVAMEAEQLVKEGATPEMLNAWSGQSVESGRCMGWTAINPDAILADVLREVIGPTPLRRVAIPPAVLLWNGGMIPKLAQSIYDDRAFDQLLKLAHSVYDDRAFDQLPVLADALEEAGCTSRDVLDHCRSPGPHVRGCWAVDLVLGKE